jgi:DNA-binding SARP family transcriptional activator/tetratricopeptide (TPR) repeat protein
VDAVFSILGSTALRVGGEWDQSSPPRERAILAALLINAGKPVSLDTLVDWVHEDETLLRNPAATFHTYAARIRKNLQRLPVDAPLVVQDRTFRLGIDPRLVDFHLFRKLMAEAHGLRRQHHNALALDRARQAISLRRGRPIDDLHTERARVWRHRLLVNDWLPANTMVLEILLELDEYTTVLSQVDELLDEHPHDLALAKIRMAALHGSGRGTEATDYYFNLRRRLRDEADFQAADHVRRFHDGLLGTAPSTEKEKADEAPVPRLLPHDIEFVGRSELLRVLDSTATKRAGRVVILDGMAGVGKTALAVRWGHLARHRFPDGDFFFDLNGFSSDAVVSQSRVVDDLLISIGHRPDNRLDQHARGLLLRGLLAGRHALVVLDNARDTAHVKDLIALMPSCVVVVTSRDRLSLLSTTTGAHRVHVEPMPAGEAAELLSVRLGPHRDIEPDDRARVVRLCGGLPMLISLLAEHIAASGIARLSAFVERLDRRKLLLDIGENVDGSAVAHTLLYWSYRLLAPAEQRLFRLLGLHPGPDVGFDGACALDGRTPRETRQSLGVLVGAHLLERLDPFGDRHQFHDFFREFAAFRAERDESPDGRQAAERRILSFYLHSAGHANHVLYPYRTTLSALPVEDNVEPVTFDDAAAAKLWFDQERANLIAAVRFASSRGHHTHAPRIADVVTGYLDRHGRYGDSRTVRELAVSSAHAAADRDTEMSSLEGLGMVQMIMGDHAQSRRSLNTALRYAMEDRNERAQDTCLHLLGRLAMQRGDPATAVELYLRCIDVAQRIDDLVGQCWSHCRIGEPLRLLDQHDDALLHLFRALSLAEHVNEPSAHAHALATIASVYRDKGDPHAAKAHATKALTAAQAIPDLGVTVRVCIALAEIAVECGDPAGSARHARHALDVCRQTHNLSDEARASEVLGNALLAAGDTVNAVAAWQHAATTYDRTGNATRAVLLRARADKMPPTGDIDLPTARSSSPSPDLVKDHDTTADRRY